MPVHNDFVSIDIICIRPELPCFLDAYRCPIVLFHLLNEQFDFAVISIMNAMDVLVDNCVHSTFVEGTLRFMLCDHINWRWQFFSVGSRSRVRLVVVIDVPFIVVFHLFQRVVQYIVVPVSSSRRWHGRKCLVVSSMSLFRVGGSYTSQVGGSPVGRDIGEVGAGGNHDGALGDVGWAVVVGI